MIEAAHLVLDMLLCDADTAAALADPRRADFADTRAALLDQYQLAADYSPGEVSPAVLIERDIDATERRLTCLRAIQTQEKSK
jgi:hypothetical protein